MTTRQGPREAGIVLGKVGRQFHALAVHRIFGFAQLCAHAQRTLPDHFVATFTDIQDGLSGALKITKTRSVRGGLAIIGVLASVVGAFYYLRIIKIMYFDAPEEGFDGPITLEMKSILVVTGVFVLLFIFLPGPILTGAEAASAALFPG